jgi:arylsulfatase A-like enzyme
MSHDASPDRDPRLEPEPFRGTVGPTVHESTPWWPAARRPRDGAPNVVVVVLDDVGFAQLGTYGSSISTPNMDRLADNGLRYTNFHVTSLCSTTRACLLTGRNQHSVGVGFLADFDTGFPAYRGAISVRAATLGEMLGDVGYSTYAVGKWHLTPPSQMSPIGPFHQWPTQRGFDRYYGFLWGEDDQWTPELWYDQHRVDPPKTDGYHLSEDLVDRAQEFLSDHLSLAPDRPFFLYLAFGACHAPHQAPRSFIEKYRGAFDHGWDEERERVLRRQMELGVVPEGTELAPPNPGVRPWDSLPPELQRLYARMQEAFAGFMDHTDQQIGRLVEFLAAYGQLDNTVIVLLSDNGASGEGGEHGSANEYRYFLGIDDPVEDSLAAIDEIGSPATHNHYPMGWAQAGNTPLKHYKKYTFGGGVRAPMIVHWPSGFGCDGGLRAQFHHAIDIVPTILELAGAQAPAVYRGVPQLDVHGTSFAYTFTEPDAPSRHASQYFETAGHRGIYRGGFKAVTYHEPGTPFEDDRWELYALDRDFSECHDLAESQPALVAELRDDWWNEARRYGVLPLDDRMQARVETRDPVTERTHYEMLPGSRMPTSVVGPNFTGRAFRVEASVELRGANDEGVLLAHGRRAAGFSFFIQQGKLVLDYNMGGRHTVIETEQAVPVGASTLGVEVVPDDDGFVARLLVNGGVAAMGAVPGPMPGGLGCLSTQCGHNSPSAVSPRYAAPFRFKGRLHRVVVDLGVRTEASEEIDWASSLAQD